MDGASMDNWDMVTFWITWFLISWKHCAMSLYLRYLLLSNAVIRYADTIWFTLFVNCCCGVTCKYNFPGHMFQISGGWRHTMAVTSDGKLYGWGWNKVTSLYFSSVIPSCPTLCEMYMYLLVFFRQLYLCSCVIGAYSDVYLIILFNSFD